MLVVGINFFTLGGRGFWEPDNYEKQGEKSWILQLSVALLITYLVSGSMQ